MFSKFNSGVVCVHSGIFDDSLAYSVSACNPQLVLFCVASKIFPPFTFMSITATLHFLTHHQSRLMCSNFRYQSFIYFFFLHLSCYSKIILTLFLHNYNHFVLKITLFTLFTLITLFSNLFL